MAEHESEYFVNGERHLTSERKMKMSDLVEGAGFVPASDYELEEEDHGHKTYVNPDDEVNVHKGQHFTVTYKGPTQTS